MSATSSPRSVTSATFEKFERRISLDNLLREANLDRDALLQIIKQNPVAINDLDESKIQSIVQQATKAKQNQNGQQSSNPFAFDIDRNNPDILEEKKDDDYDEDDVIPTITDYDNNDRNEINSHYKMIRNEFMNLRQNMKEIQNKIKLESYLSDLKEKKQHNERLLKLQELSRRKKEVMMECNRMEQEYKREKELICFKISNIEILIENELKEQQNLLLKKIALQQNVSRFQDKFEKLVIEKKRFSEMKDISQFKPIAVFYVLKYLEITDFISSILCCRAWYFSLNKPCYWRIIQSNIIHKNKDIIHDHIKYKQLNLDKNELVSCETKLKRINHAVMQLKIEPKQKKTKKKRNTQSAPRPDDIYQQCMQQLQKVIAQSEQDREELEDRVKAQMGILKFMQTSMYGKMHELAELRVRKWELKDKSCSQYQIAKRNLAEKIKNLEINLNKNRLIIDNMKQNMMEQEMIRCKKLKIQCDLKSVKSGTSSIEMNDELKKLKQQNKKLAQVIVKLRKEIPKRKQDIKKYKNRVDLLQSQYSQYTQQPLP